jgi:hypothetical protein
MAIRDDWAPDACTLPTAERPLRVAEFDDLFTAVRRSERPLPTRLDLVLPRNIEAAARNLALREATAVRSSRSSSGRLATMS